MSHARPAPCTMVTAGLALVLNLWAPAPASAQRQAFLANLTELTDALPGTYGDEGARADAAL